METRLKLKLSRMFRSSFVSCRPRNSSDIMENTSFASQKQNLEPLCPKTRSFSSIYRPETENSVSGTKKSEPISDLTRFFDEHSQSVNNYTKKLKKPKKKNKKKQSKKKPFTDHTLFSSSSLDSTYYNDNGGWWSSSEEDETETFFSSRSLSSDSSFTRRRRRRNGDSRRRKGGSSSMRGGSSKRHGDDEVFPVMGGGDERVKDSFAVVKKSSDPYGDFRTSMVEMIVEKQMFGGGDLEQLLQCFLALNSSHHHKVIVQVFMEIYETLFSI